MSPGLVPSKITKSELEHAKQSMALHLSRIRKSEALGHFAGLDSLVNSSREQMEGDWRNASILLGAKVVAGEVRLTDLEPSCFTDIEDVWLDEVKRHSAYYAWLKTGSNHTACYFEACDELRRLLIDRRTKDRLENFSAVREYIKSHYLDEFDNVFAQEVIEAKANKISASGEVAQHIAEHLALEYTKTFYQNIIPAVEDQDRDACKAVLGALRHGGTVPPLAEIVNCFEAAIAIGFLESNIVQKFWRESPQLSKDTTF